MKNSEYIEQIRGQLKGYLDKYDISANAASRSIGKSSATISQFLNEDYPGDNYKVAQSVAAFLKRQKEKQDQDEVLVETIKTKAVNKICQAARMCHIQCEMGVATGDAGVGKSRGCAYYAAQNPDVIYIEVIPGMTTKKLMGKLHKETGYNGQGAIYDMFTDVVDRLKDSDRMIIVDEAENLPYTGLELLRRLYDIAGIGILLAGMPELIANLRGNKGEYKQLYSRIGIHAHIPDMKDSPADVEALVKSALPGSNGVWKTFHSITPNGRALEKLIKRSIQVAQANETEVDAEVVKNAKQYIII